MCAIQFIKCILDNLCFNFLSHETCLEADIIIESICLVHLVLAGRYIPKCL